MTTEALDTGLADELAGIVGADGVMLDADDRAFYSRDVYYAPAQPAAAVVRPGTVAELAAAVRAATRAGYAVQARGGGTSYTGGFVPDRARSVVADTSGLDAVAEINTGDGYVVVEAGCTWKRLYEALGGHGVRTPFWGPFSGAVATVGGSLSQNSILWGSGRYGSSNETVLGLEVVLADGTLVRTGSWSTTGAKPFSRIHGPDLTGLFLGDTGAFGVKARAALRLIPTPQHVGFASFSFETMEAMALAMSELARQDLAAGVIGMDPVLQQQRMKRTSLLKDARSFTGVARSSGVREAMKVALAGRRFMSDVQYSTHVTVEGRSEAAVEADLAAVRQVCHAGHEIENSIPKVMYGDPFAEMTSAIGPEGERWVPIHGIVPLSESASAWQAVNALLAEYEEPFERHDIVVGALTATLSTWGFVLEPVFYWPGPRTLWYERMLDPGHLAKLTDFPRRPEIDELVEEVRSGLTALFLELGAAHLQVGKTYRYREGREPGTWQLLDAIKSAVDPDRLLSPGSLGLD